DRALPVGDLTLPHAVADHLAASELHLLAVRGEILLHLDDQVGVGKPHAVAGRRAEHVGVDGALHFHCHGGSLRCLNSSPVLSTGVVGYAVSIASRRSRAILFSRCSWPVRRTW